MIKRVAVTLLLAISISLDAKTNIEAMGSSIPAASYIVKEVGSSELLMAKNKDARVQPASLTKILTSIIAIESGRLEESVVIPPEATVVEPSKAGFRAGDEILLLDLVKAAMVSSSNDAAFAIGIYLGGSIEGFAKIMNQKASQIGMKNSNFTNPAGFDKGKYAGNYSTARDLLKLTEYCIKNKIFNDIAKLERVTIIEQRSGKIYNLETHNKLLDKYKYAVGIKTGYTSKAGKCLIARAKKDNRDVLLVMLKARADRWRIAENVFEKVFDMKAPEPELVEELQSNAASTPKGESSSVSNASKGRFLSKKASKRGALKLAKNKKSYETTKKRGVRESIKRAGKTVNKTKRLKIAHRTKNNKKLTEKM